MTPTGDNPGHAPSDFRTRHWSVVLAAARTDSPQRQSARTSLCQTYWYPLYAFVRRQGRNPHEAEDLTQEYERKPVSLPASQQSSLPEMRKTY